MKRLWKMMHDYQENNVEGRGINFTEEGFTELFDETVKAGIEHATDVRVATGKGILIGATSVGLTWLGVEGFKKFRKRKLKDGEKVTEVLEDIGTVESFEPNAIKPEVVRSNNGRRGAR